MVTVGNAMRGAALQALKRVEVREPEIRVEQKTSLKLKENTPLKAMFRKMSEMPISAFSIQLREGGEDASCADRPRSVSVFALHPCPLPEAERVTANSLDGAVDFVVSAEPTAEVFLLGNPFNVAVREGHVLAGGPMVVARVGVIVIL